jgi:hypothetical protein
MLAPITCFPLYPAGPKTMFSRDHCWPLLAVFPVGLLAAGMCFPLFTMLATCLMLGLFPVLASILVFS